MKKTINKIAAITLLLFVSVSFTSCLEGDAVDFGKTPVLVQFESTAINAIFLQDPVNPETFTYNIPVIIIGGKNLALNKDVKVTFELDASSTATEGNQFNFAGEKTVTLPAGETSVGIPITVPAGNLDAFDPKTVVLKITSTSEIISEADKTTVTLQAACTLNLDSFIGTYTANKVGVASPYNVTVTLGPVANTLMLTNLDERNGQTVIELSTDVTDPTITYRSKEFDAFTYIHGLGGVSARTVKPELSSYNSCDNYMILEFKRCIPDDRCFGGTRQITLTKQ